MSLEHPTNIESTPTTKIETAPGYEGVLPEDFTADPFRYFETRGRNIKSGEVEYGPDGEVSEDPTATKDLALRDTSGGEKHVVAKKVNTIKSQVGKSGDPFYEYSIMQLAREFGLPAPRPIAKISRGGEHLILMERVAGIRWTDAGMTPIHESDLTPADKQAMLAQAEDIVARIAEQYAAIGLSRNWKMKDMIFHVDIPNRKVLDVTPTDWERTKIDYEKLAAARNAREAT